MRRNLCSRSKPYPTPNMSYSVVPIRPCAEIRVKLGHREKITSVHSFLLRVHVTERKKDGKTSSGWFIFMDGMREMIRRNWCSA